MKKILTLTLVTLFLSACGNTKTSSTQEESPITEKTAQTPRVKNLAQSDLAAKIADSAVVVIDVRTPREVAGGFIEGADKFLNINDSNFEAEINKLDKNATYVIYCHSGARSGRAASMMVANGFSDVYNLQGGIMSYGGKKVR